MTVVIFNIAHGVIFQKKYSGRLFTGNTLGGFFWGKVPWRFFNIARGEIFPKNTLGGFLPKIPWGFFGEKCPGGLFNIARGGIFQKNTLGGFSPKIPWGAFW